MSAREGLRDEFTMAVGMTLVMLAASMFTPGYATADTLPVARTQGSVQYVSGGIGKDESDAMKQAGAEYPLLLEFASARRGAADGNGKGEYVSDVDVAIRDAQGNEILHAQADGPFMLVRVPPGKYAVRAEWRGVRKQGNADVIAGAHKHLVMAW